MNWLMRRRDERGVGTVLVATLCTVLLGLAWAAAVAIGWLGCARSAQDAADLAALAGASAWAEGADPCAAAREAAARNDGAVTSCSREGDRHSFAVRVEVSMALHPVVPGFPEEVVRSASAGTG